MGYRLIAPMLSLLVTTTIFAQDTSHYPPGAEGIKAASIPGPGKYLKWYNFYYEADKLKDSNRKTAPGRFNVDAFATAPRLIWITEKKILGADYGWDILVPLVYTDVDIPGAGNSHTGIGDIYVEPFLFGWQRQFCTLCSLPLRELVKIFLSWKSQQLHPRLPAQKLKHRLRLKAAGSIEDLA